MFHRIVIIVKSLGKIARHEKKSIIQTSVLFDRLTKDSHLQEQNATFTFKMPVHLLLLADGKKVVRQDGSLKIMFHFGLINTFFFP